MSTAYHSRYSEFVGWKYENLKFYISEMNWPRNLNNSWQFISADVQQVQNFFKHAKYKAFCCVIWHRTVHTPVR